MHQLGWMKPHEGFSEGPMSLPWQGHSIPYLIDDTGRVCGCQVVEVQRVEDALRADDARALATCDVVKRPLRMVIQNCDTCFLATR